MLLQAGEAQSPVDIPFKARAAAAGQRGDLDLQYSQKGDLELEYNTTSPSGQRGELKLKYTQKEGQRGDLNVQYSQTPRGELKLHYSQNSVAGQRGDLSLRFSQTPVTGQRGDLELKYSQFSGATVKNNGHGALQVWLAAGPQRTVVRCLLPLAQPAASSQDIHVCVAGCAVDRQLVVQECLVLLGAHATRMLSLCRSMYPRATSACWMGRNWSWCSTTSTPPASTPLMGLPLPWRPTWSTKTSPQVSVPVAQRHATA